MNDLLIIENLKAGDNRRRNIALREVYAAYYDYVSNYIMKNSGSENDAKDVFQDSIIVMYEKIQQDDFELTCALKTYLYSISKNIWLNRLRKKSKNIPLENDYEEVDVDANALESMEQDELNKYYHQLLQKVDKESQKIIRLYYYEKKRMKEIAKIMGYANEQVAKNKKARSIKKLRALLSESHLKFIFT